MPDRESRNSNGVHADDATDSDITDEELTALALAADPDAPIAADAIPLAVHLSQFAAPLPLWYMPPVARAVSGRRWKTPVVVAVVAAFLLIDALGLCNTYGVLSFA